jgi:hypothetical protein
MCIVYEILVCFRYAYLEYADEKVAYDMSQKYKDAEINGEKLYVIPAISEKKEKYGKFLNGFGFSINGKWKDLCSHNVF